MEDNIINLTTEQISLVTILLSEFPYSNMAETIVFKDALNMVNTHKFSLQQINDMKELISDFLFELVSICEDEEYFEKELNEMKQSEEFKKELDDLLGDEFDLEDFKEIIRQVNNENQNSIRKFYEKDYKTFRKLIDGYESVLLENGSISEIIRCVSKTSTLGSLLNYFLEHGTLTDIFTDEEWRLKTSILKL